MQHYDRLKHEILEDPENLGYAGKTPAEIAAILNAKERTTSVPVAMPDLLAFLVKHQLLRKMAAIGIDSPIYDAVQSMKIMLNSSISSVSLERPEIKEGVKAMLEAGFVTQAQVQELAAIATVKISRSEELNLGGEVWEAHIPEALGENLNGTV